MLESEALERLRGGKNLLAFSGGVDSSALYHLLKEEGISFDLALFNYKTRPESDEEEVYARALAMRDGKKLFVKTAPMSLEEGNFEAKARRLRYDFFEELLRTKGYDTLVTAHQLDDLLEWGLMQLCRGCGVAELVGMVPVECKEGYDLVRPLLFTPKAKLLDYLKSHSIRFFQDTSNLDTLHTRNRFRQNAAAFLMEECSEGIARSFRYMMEDRRRLFPEPKVLFACKALTLLRRPPHDDAAIRQIDRLLKSRGYLLSSAQREEILRQRSAVIGGQWVVILEEKRVWIAPAADATMPKPFKERCRRAKIPAKIRPYLFREDCLEALLSALSRFSS